MPEWDDGRTWPRQPRSPADAIRPPRSGCGGKKKIMPIIGLMVACAVSALAIVGVVLMAVANALVAVTGSVPGAAVLGLSGLWVISRLRWLL